MFAIEDETKLNELRAQCPDGELLTLKVDLQGKLIVVYAKAPNRAIYKRFKQKSKSSHNDAMEEMVSTCILHPGGVEVQKLFDRWPGLIDTFSEALFTAIGLTQTADIETKK